MRIPARRPEGTTPTCLARVNLAIDHIAGHLGEPLRLRDLARVAMLSPFHFHRVFQAIVGTTPAEFVKRLRLEKALRLMARVPARGRRPTLTAVALACGFSSSSDFSRTFRSRYGAPPRAFDLDAWRKARRQSLRSAVSRASGESHRVGLPPRRNPDRFRVRIRDVPARTVAYIRVTRPYEDDAVPAAARRLLAWAERNGLEDGQWLGYQWDNPEITPLEHCGYYVAVEAQRFAPQGAVGRHRFPPMTVAEITVRGGLDLELRALQWLYGAWLPRSGYEPDDHPGFEAWIGRPYAHGTQYFELRLQLPVRRLAGAARARRAPCAHLRAAS